MYSCPSMYLLFLEIGIIPIESFQLKLWHFHAKLVGLPGLHWEQSEFLIFLRRLNFIPDPGSLYSFEAKVLMVHFQLESPKSEHRNSSYVQNNPNYSMIKSDAGISLHMAPL